MARRVIVCRWQVVVHVETHERLALGKVVVEAVASGENHVALPRLHDARHGVAPETFCHVVCANLAFLLVDAADVVVAERHPHAPLAVGIDVSQAVGAQRHAFGGLAVMPHYALGVFVHLVHSIACAYPHILAMQAHGLASAAYETFHGTEFAALLVEHEHVATAYPEVAVAAVAYCPDDVAAIAVERNLVVGESVGAGVKSRKSLVVHCHPHIGVIACH